MSAELQALGAGTTLISQSAFRKLDRQKHLMRFVQACCLLMGSGMFLGGWGSFAVHVPNGFVDEAGSLQTFSLYSIPLGAFMMFEAVFCADFVLALHVAAALASDAVLEVVHAVTRTEPSDLEVWQQVVVGPALALSDGPVGLLSQGFGRGLALAFFGW